MFTLSRLSFYGQLLEQLNVASLSCPILSFCSVTHCYCYRLLCPNITTHDDDDDDIALYVRGRDLRCILHCLMLMLYCLNTTPLLRYLTNKLAYVVLHYIDVLHFI